VTIFEKSRGLGGRVATRRTPVAAFDHGAPLLHGLPEALVKAAGVAAAPWRDGVVGVPGNASFARAVSVGLEVRTGSRVTGIAGHAGAWVIEQEAESAAGPYDTVLVALPQPQAIELLGTARPAAFAGLDWAAMEPGWTLMAAFDRTLALPDWQVLDGPLGLAVRNSAKPDRTGPEAWVVHADQDFARAELEGGAESIAECLVAALRAQTGAPEPLFALAHRWRYGRTARPIGMPCLWDRDARLGLAGDWCLGRDAGHAVASGHALAEALLGV
jgi:predicted NAD/FAD-dependent oxidoreductase